MGYRWVLSLHICLKHQRTTSTEARPSKDRQSNFGSGKDVDDLGVLKTEQCTPNSGQLFVDSWIVIISPQYLGGLRQTHLVSSYFFSH